MPGPEIKMGSIFPTKDIGADSASILHFVPNVEKIGLDFVVAYDHIVGVNEQLHDMSDADTSCTFNSETNVHEPMVVFAAMAALSKRIKLITGCLVSPQRPTALIAKQAAELDILSNGRFELGVSIGWNEVEFAALGAHYKNRAHKLEYQVRLLRRLWTDDDVVSDNSDEKFDHVNIRPLPLQQPIPIWIGGLAHKAVERAARIGDGWLPLGYIDEAMTDRTEHYWQVRQEELGRHDGQIMGRINPWNSSYSAAYRDYIDWTAAGATHLAIGSSQDVFRSSEQYFDELRHFKTYLDSKIARKILWIPKDIAKASDGFAISVAEAHDDLEELSNIGSEPLVCVITGTHSSGKSTLLHDFEDGKLTELGVFHPEYDDFGYGVIENFDTKMQVPVINVPEAARWMAELYGRPDFLAENYNLDFQLSIDIETIFRTHAASSLADVVISQLIDTGRIDKERVARPVVLSDRSPLDGIIYSEARIPEDTNRIGTFPRTGFFSEWLKSFVDVTVVTDFTEVTFEDDKTRLDDLEFRNAIASSTEANYRSFMLPSQVYTLSGDRTARKNKLISIISEHINKTRTPVTFLPYSKWHEVSLVQ